jgi:hypothetical protein
MELTDIIDGNDDMEILVAVLKIFRQNLAEDRTVNKFRDQGDAE